MGEYYYPVLFAKWTEKKHDGEMKVRRHWKGMKCTTEFCDYDLVDKYKVMDFYSHGYQHEYVGRDGKTWSSGEGLKMMEHCYFGGKMMTHVLAEIEKYSKKPEAEIRLIWISDYAGSLPVPKSEDGDYAKQNMYQVAQAITGGYWLKCTRADPNKVPKSSETGYIVNKEKQEYITVYNHRLDGDWNRNICPLPLLTQFNEGGGGNYLGDNQDLLGSWCLDKLEYTRLKPTGDMKCLDGLFKDSRE